MMIDLADQTVWCCMFTSDRYPINTIIITANRTLLDLLHSFSSQCSVRTLSSLFGSTFSCSSRVICFLLSSHLMNRDLPLTQNSAPFSLLQSFLEVNSLHPNQLVQSPGQVKLDLNK